MFEVFFQVLNHILLLIRLLLLYLSEIFSVLQVGELVHILLYLILLFSEAFSLYHDLLDAIKLVVIFNHKVVLIAAFLHLFKHLQSQPT